MNVVIHPLTPDRGFVVERERVTVRCEFLVTLRTC